MGEPSKALEQGPSRLSTADSEGNPLRPCGAPADGLGDRTAAGRQDHLPETGYMYAPRRLPLKLLLEEGGCIVC